VIYARRKIVWFPLFSRALRESIIPLSMPECTLTFISIFFLICCNCFTRGKRLSRSNKRQNLKIHTPTHTHTYTHKLIEMIKFVYNYLAISQSPNAPNRGIHYTEQVYVTVSLMNVGRTSSQVCWEKSTLILLKIIHFVLLKQLMPHPTKWIDRMKCRLIKWRRNGCSCRLTACGRCGQCLDGGQRSQRRWSRH